MAFEALPERLAQVRAEIARLAPQAVTIVAVTKGFGTDAVRAARDVGLADIGENRVQEALQKQDALRDVDGIRWHLIGHLQRNKAKLVPGGFAPADTAALARQVAALGALRLEGLMTLAPLTDDVDVQRRTFRKLRVLRDRIKEEVGVWLPTLSMGMSGDYASAVAEGATVIRLGTVLFGPRT